jgi:hypothetical protein
MDGNKPDSSQLLIQDSELSNFEAADPFGSGMVGSPSMVSENLWRGKL